MQNEFIQTTESLKDLCSRLSKHKFITVDTEFLREKTYWPQLCLIQVASEEEGACIDPLAQDIDLSSFFELMQNEKIVKVFHAAHQDIEIIYHLSGKTPTPVFDTQLAAMVCGFGESVSYQNIVFKLLNREIDKSMRFTDWSRRPLTEKQIHYALNDVTHLRDVYVKLLGILSDNNRTSWLNDEMQKLTDVKTYKIDPNDAWKKLKINSTNRQALAICKEICAFREEEAQKSNHIRKAILRDEVIEEIAHNIPTNADALSKLRGIPQGFANGRLGKAILGIIETIKNQPITSYPEIEKAFELPKSARNLSKMLKVLLTIRATQSGVAERLICSPDDLDKYCCFENENSPIMSGWKFEIFGKYAQKMKDGKLGLVYNPSTKQIDLIEEE
ncbi:MAG: ribonuclease D [Alphaproteobacteria bacterium]|nr:ribonuclease D [Alphaproteobacteria bacterium]